MDTGREHHYVHVIQHTVGDPGGKSLDTDGLYTSARCVGRRWRAVSRATVGGVDLYRPGGAWKPPRTCSRWRAMSTAVRSSRYGAMTWIPMGRPWGVSPAGATAAGRWDPPASPVRVDRSALAPPASAEHTTRTGAGPPPPDTNRVPVAGRRVSDPRVSPRLRGVRETASRPLTREMSCPAGKACPCTTERSTGSRPRGRQQPSLCPFNAAAAGAVIPDAGVVRQFTAPLTDLQPGVDDPLDGATARLTMIEHAGSTTFVLIVTDVDPAAAGQTYGAHLHVGPCVAGEGAAAGPHYNSRSSRVDDSGGQ